MNWFCRLLFVISLLTLVNGHHGGGGGGGGHKHHMTHENHHATHHREQSDKRHHAFGGGASVGTTEEPEGELDLDALDANVEEDDPLASQSLATKPKLFAFDICRQQNEPTKLVVYNNERYGNWSDWSKCLPRDCIEVRYRKCLDDSWQRPTADKIHTTKCLSKYYAEKRTCANRTQCNSHVGSQILGKLSDTCGVKSRNSNIMLKIIGGKTPEPHSWPWAVRISVRPPGTKPITFCGGTLIAPQWIMTAAHCLLVENKRMPVGRPVKLADHMRSTIHVHLGDHHVGKQERVQQDYRVRTAILHPKYHRKLMTDGDDIALLYLDVPVNITTGVNFACLPAKEMRLKPGTQCYAVGWGQTGTGRQPTFDDLGGLFDSFFLPFPNLFGRKPSFGHRGRPSDSWSYRRRSTRKTDDGTEEIHEVRLPIVSIDECERHYSELNEEVHICAGTKGKDTCSGDSGGGLYCQVPGSNQWTVAGVTSFGLARGCGLNPGVYTSVHAHLDWVWKQLGDPQEQIEL